MNEDILNFVTNQIGLLILIPIIVAVSNFIFNSYFTELFANREKKSRRELWFNFFRKYDRYIHKCLLQFEDIERPRGIFTSFLPLLGFTSGYFGPFILLYIMLKYSIDISYSIVISIFLIFLIGIILTAITEEYIKKIKKSENFLERSKFVIKSITFINWLTFSSSPTAILFSYLFYIYPDKIIKSDLFNFLSASAFLSWLIILIFPSIIRRDLLNYSKKLLNLKYFEKFPYLYVKTTSTDFEGKICDVFDKNLIILDNNGDKKAAEWHSVTSLELKKSEEPKENITNEKDDIARIETTKISSKLKNWIHNSIKWVARRTKYKPKSEKE